MTRAKHLMGTVTVLLAIYGVTLAEGGPQFEFTADVFSKYVWRGQNLVDDPVFQPGASASYAGFTAGIWGNLDLAEANGFEGNFTEVDYSLDYSGTLPAVDVLGYSVGVIYYDFPHTGISGTTELYWGLSADVPLNPAFTVYHDVDEADGTYACASVAHSIENVTELAPDVSLGVEVGASVGWGDGDYNMFYWGTAGGELNDLVLSVSFPITVAGWTITPSVAYVRLLGGDIRDSNAYGADDDLVYAGIGVARAF